MAKQVATSNHVKKPKVKRPNVHAKSKTSHLKTSKNYKKLNRGQGWVTKKKEAVREVVNVGVYVKTELITESVVTETYKTKE